MTKGSDPRHKPRSKRELEEGLRRIYADKDGQLPNLTSLESVRSSHFTRFLWKTILLLFVVAGIGWGAFFLWRPFSIRGSHPLAISIEGPTDVTVGEETTYHLRYKNTSTVPIADLEIQINLPKGFILGTTQPPSTEKDIWTVGSLLPDSDGVIDLTGIFRSAVPSTEKIQTFLTYRPANFSSDFRDVSGLSIAVTNSLLKTSITGPEKTGPGDENIFQITVQNISTESIDHIQIRSLFPESFTLSKSEPAAETEGVAQWNIPFIEANGTYLLTLTGAFTAAGSGTLPIKISTGLLDDQNIFLLQSESQTNIDLLDAELAIHLIVNGSEKNQTTNLGDRLRISIDYSNQGRETIEGVLLTLTLGTPDRSLPIDWTKADLAGAKRNGNQLVWDEKTLPVFSSIAPDTSGIIDLVLPILSAINPTTVSDLFNVELATSMKKIGTVEHERTVKTQPIEIRLNSDATFSAVARYFDTDGNPVGSGPLPPKTGETTIYRIFWNVTNTLHDLKSLSLETTLPSDIAWTGKNLTSDGTIHFDETTRMISWTIPSLSISTSNPQAWFEVAVTPENEDIGSFLKLTNTTSFEAIDTITEYIIHGSVDILDTELPKDELASGKGIVEE
ncbi:MAG: hypothetical protein UU48_C0001G0002 [Candidatus Uhrbacteria bacterium GW2011_GWF2_41_16]|uniref:DUF11 domain-containing protein n=2 Tax=Candidatus Uhriibacteriota TaxID=1752732 RepID=A0A0G0YEB6_9BACT|nr:MAG: hypothetical protein UU35_C0022G0014 [Candidatus Uhrbacteria bacterium GW2011_GWC2_41_11]KKR98647.1 MAG: hypothetical protein UU48_C0001G0002 [Candidatus Uhrbacteria bacterium GW2011_GWF2_41_16]HBP00046.1 hypothetical protein [Candidatus Uhrbacteria bacterium]